VSLLHAATTAASAITPTGAATNSPAAASSMKALKLWASTVLVRVRVDTIKVDSSTALWTLKRSARPDHRNEDGAETQGFMAAEQRGSGKGSV